MPTVAPNIPGADVVVATLGRWPSFHDAEITRLHLERDGVSTISIQIVGPGGGCQEGRVVTFTLERLQHQERFPRLHDEANRTMSPEWHRIVEKWRSRPMR